MTLRERLIALADANDDAMSGTDWAEHKMRYIVLAAAKLALEDAARECDDKAIIYDGLESDASTRYFSDKMRGSRDASEQCAAAIRALRDGL